MPAPHQAPPSEGAGMHTRGSSPRDAQVSTRYAHAHSTGIKGDSITRGASLDKKPQFHASAEYRVAALPTIRPGCYLGRNVPKVALHPPDVIPSWRWRPGHAFVRHKGNTVPLPHAHIRGARQ
jgi:surface antigen